MMNGKRDIQQEMYELSKAMPMLSTQLAAWCAYVDRLDQEIKDQGTVITIQVEQLNQLDDEIERLGKINNELRKKLK